MSKAAQHSIHCPDVVYNISDLDSMLVRVGGLCHIHFALKYIFGW